MLFPFVCVLRPTVGTRGYIAPEVQRDPRAISAKSDIFSMGVVFVEMFTLNRAREHPQKLAAEIASRTPSLKWITKVCFSMLHPDPAARPTAMDLVDEFERRENLTADLTPTWSGGDTFENATTC